jgi:hypothetical protein
MGITGQFMNRRSGPWVVGVAATGVAAGHSLAYFVAVPDGGMRRALLSATGHSYWHAAVLVALLLGLGSAGTVAVRHFRAGRTGQSLPPLGTLQLAGRLSLIQVAAFAILEVTERALAGVPVGTMLQGHVFGLGVAIQLLLALVGALLLRWLAQTAEAMGSSLRPCSLPRPDSVGLPPHLDLPALCPLCDACRGRAPPFPLASTP